MNISLCIATYRRPERLAALLEDLLQQTLQPLEIVVVDNHAEGSARAVVEHCRAVGGPVPIHYEIQPLRNIAMTRNRCVALAARGDWLAFIDDDERASPEWLARLADAAERLRADAVLAPVLPIVPDSAPDWIRRGRFYDFPRLATGTTVPLNRLRFGNIIVRAEPLRAEPGPFDVRYGLATGEDADLLVRLVQKGCRVVWCDEAVVTEPVEPARLSLRWLLQRALSGGQEFARKTLRGQYGPVSLTGRLRLFSRALLQMLAAALLAVLAIPLGRRRMAEWLVKAAANFGKLSILSGWRYDEYARTMP